MLRPLLSYQVPAWDYARTRDRIALFMKMRLGKTIITIRWVQHRLPRDAQILIIAPLSVLPGWLDELRLEGEEGTILLGNSCQKMRALSSCTTRWVLVNPEGFTARKKKRGESRPPMSSIAKAITSVAWDCVVLDESTFLNNPQSAITQLIRKEFKDVQLKAVLAGEPAPESDLGFFEQFAFLHDEFMGCRTYYHFRNKYFFRPGFEWQPRHPGFKKKLREEVRRLGFVLSARQAGVVYEKLYERRYVHLLPDAQKQYREVRRSFATDGMDTKWSIVSVGWLSRMAGGCLPKRGAPTPFSTHKIDELEYLLVSRFSGESVLVWFRYSDEIRFCAERLEKRNIRFRSITGKTPVKLRGAYVKAFNAYNFPVMLVQSKCARFGLNLQAANTSIFYSNWWDWLTRAQAEARMEHPTKAGATLRYIDLITANTYDEAVLEILRGKKVNSRYFLQKVMVRCASLNRSRRKNDGHGRVANDARRASANRRSACRGLGSKRSETV